MPSGEASISCTFAWCERCGAEGRLYTSRYGGNDPDVWDVGECPNCRGTGREEIPVSPIEMEDLEQEDAVEQWNNLESRE